MVNLDNQKEIEKIDRENLLKNIEEFPLQCERAWEETKKIVLPSYYVSIDKIIVLGMGGSAIGGDLSQFFAQKKSKAPLFVLRDYELPAFVDKNSLVIAISYSGETEETLSAFSEALSRKSKLIAISKGGSLIEKAKRNKIPYYQFSYESQPRQSLGFLFIPILGILNKLALLDLKDEEIKEDILVLKGLNNKLKPEVPTVRNQAKKIALEIFEKIPIILAPFNLTPVALRFKDQINENAGQLAFVEIIPESCHNFIAGLSAPSKLSEKIFSLFLSSKYEHPRTSQRVNILKEILDKKEIPYEGVEIEPAPSVLSETLSFVLLLDYTSFYLAILNKKDPYEIKDIDYLKKRLKEVLWPK